jgi:shikimate dehydrogenase
MGVPYAEVIGDPIAHSKSPLIHKFWLEKLRIDGDYRPMRVRADEFHHYLGERRGDPDWRGCNVTMPLKELVVPFVGRLDDSAEKAEAVNTIVHGRERELRGLNTDLRAVTQLLASVPKARYPNHVATYVQIVGAGGAARAAVIGAIAAGYSNFDLFNRTFEKAAALARWLSLPSPYAHPLEALGPMRNEEDGPDDQRYSHILINASPLGMAGAGELEVSLADYYPDTVILDMPYAGPETKLARDARALGLTVFDGLDMLVAQASHAFAAFFGMEAPREHDEELRAVLAR